MRAASRRQIGASGDRVGVLSTSAASMVPDVNSISDGFSERIRKRFDVGQMDGLSVGKTVNPDNPSVSLSGRRPIN